MKYYGLAFELALLNILLIFGGYQLDLLLKIHPTICSFRDLFSHCWHHCFID